MPKLYQNWTTHSPFEKTVIHTAWMTILASTFLLILHANFLYSTTGRAYHHLHFYPLLYGISMALYLLLYLMSFDTFTIDVFIVDRYQNTIISLINTRKLHTSEICTLILSIKRFVLSIYCALRIIRHFGFSISLCESLARLSNVISNKRFYLEPRKQPALSRLFSQAGTKPPQ